MLPPNRFLSGLHLSILRRKIIFLIFDGFPPGLTLAIVRKEVSCLTHFLLSCVRFPVLAEIIFAAFYCFPGILKFYTINVIKQISIIITDQPLQSVFYLT